MSPWGTEGGLCRGPFPQLPEVEAFRSADFGGGPFFGSGTGSSAFLAAVIWIDRLPMALWCCNLMVVFRNERLEALKLVVLEYLVYSRPGCVPKSA